MMARMSRMQHYNPTPTPKSDVSGENFNMMLEKMKALEKRVLELEKSNPKIPFKFVSDREEEERKRQISRDSIRRMRMLLSR
jgi:hypothetical protein